MNVVVWSGGCDSTLVLAQWSDTASQDNQLFAVSFEHYGVNDVKTVCEREARKKILQKINHPFVKHTTIEVRVSGDKLVFLDGDQADRQGYGLPQAVMWLGNILPWMPSKSPVWIGLGYVKGDDFWHYRNEFEQVS